MTFQLHRLSSEPEAFSPVEFTPGVNLILGEESKESQAKQAKKVNGVGKSVFVDFLHFALCRNAEKTRVSRIPEGILPNDLVVILDLTIHGTRYQIRRSIQSPDQPILLNLDLGKSQTFENLKDANDYLGTLLFRTNPLASQTSFRQLMSLLMRDEASGFRDFLNPMPARTQATPPLAPHLFLMGIDSSATQIYEQLHTEHKNLTTSTTQLKNILTDNNRLKLGDLPAKLNEQEKTVAKIETALEKLKTDPAFEATEKQLVEIEGRLRELRAERKSLTFQISQILIIPPGEHIDSSDIKIVYDRIKSGLGELVVKSLTEAQAFKNELAAFQQSLISDERQRLEREKSHLQIEIKKLTEEHAKFSELIGSRGVLSELKNGLLSASEQTESYRRQRAQLETYEQLVKDKNRAKLELEKRLDDVRTLIENNQQAARNTEKRLVEIHERIQHSSEASLRLQAVTRVSNKFPLKIELRTKADRSKSVDECKVFIYDFALLTSSLIPRNHPGFILHDNILEVDNDTLIQCLNFLHELEEETDDFQYILTLNQDKIEPSEIAENITLPIEKHVRARFSKAKKFLREDYQEI